MVAKMWLIAGALLSLYAQSLQAQAPVGTAWPTKPVRWIVPFPPGGPADIIARLVAHKLGERIGQPAVVENRGGAGGNVGHETAAKASPDGHTVLFVVPSIITNPFFFAASVDSFKDLAPVIHLDRASMVLLTHPAFPPRSVAELVAQIRAKPGSVSCAASGALPQVGCEMLRSHARADMIMVQYKGNAPALTAVVSGEVNLVFDVVNTAQGQVKSGRVRALASTNPKRGTGPFADLPVMADSIPDFDLVTWHGVMVPRATPPELVARLNRELNLVLAQPEVRERFSESGLDITGGPPENFDAVLKRDYAKYGKILKEAGIKPE
jgi:tripartite-type tricarboxylate transporter receptor subunit TctC